MPTHHTEEQEANSGSMGAEFKFRVTSDARKKLEAITARKARGNPGINLSDITREAFSEYIAHHLEEGEPSRGRARGTSASRTARRRPPGLIGERTESRAGEALMN